MLHFFTLRHKQSRLGLVCQFAGPQERRPPLHVYSQASRERPPFISLVLVAFAGPQKRDPLNLTGAGCIQGATDPCKISLVLVTRFAETVGIRIHVILQARIKSCDQFPCRQRQTNHR